ncbi:hypothetical protein TNCV_592821 [Trichonephila clavipes]|nr:hypothetical protein TNCV_592821 [Trichonephila clavipes]
MRKCLHPSLRDFIEEYDVVCKQSVIAGDRSRLYSGWRMTLTAAPIGLDLNPGEDMGVCKFIVPLRLGSSLNSHKSSREVGGRGRKVGCLKPPPRCSPSKFGVEPS